MDVYPLTDTTRIGHFKSSRLFQRIYFLDKILHQSCIVDQLNFGKNEAKELVDMSNLSLNMGTLSCSINTCHMTCNSHSECFISAEHTYATLKFLYDNGSWSTRYLV